MYFSIFYIYICLGLLFLQVNSQNCLRFCRINLQYENYQNNIVDLQSCTHIILNAYSEFELSFELLEKTLSDFQSTIFASKIKVLVEIVNRNISKAASSEIIEPKYLKYFEKFDGIYVHWSDGKLQRRNFLNKSLTEKKEVFNTFLKNLRKIFKNKLIVATIGTESSYNGYFDFKNLNENVDFVALDSGKILLQYLHQPNCFGAKLISSNERYFNNLPKDKISLDYFARTWISNGFSKDKLLIFTDGAKYDIEPRLKTIWSSLNKFSGVLIDNLERIKFPITRYSKMTEMVNNINKYEKIQICSSETIKKLSLSCYLDVSKSADEFQNIEKKLWKKCDRIIFQNSKMNSNSNNSTQNFIEFQKYLLNLNLTKIPLIFSISINFDKGDPLKIIDFIQAHNLNGIEFILDDSVNIEIVEKIVTEINTKMKNFQIGLQVNVFKAASLVSIIKNVTWVTHKFNPISDALLAIYHQWNKLHENNGLNLKKVVIKLYPGIWKQNADLNLAPNSVNSKQFADENPENDILLNRKYICLNESIRKILPNPENLLNMPLVFTEHENAQEKEKRLLKILETADGSEAIKILGTYLMFNKKYPTDLFHYRYENKEIMEYKIKIAAKHGFGGIALASINDDDINENCGNSIFREICEFINTMDLII